MTDRDPEIIEVEDYRVVSDEIATIDDSVGNDAPQYQGPVWRTEVRTAGPGCCFGLSLTVLVALSIFMLGLCALCWLALMALGVV